MEKDRLQKKGNTWDGLKRSISYVEISLIVHVTENLQKVLTAVRNLFPNPYNDNVSFKKENLWGHHKNLIIFVKTTIKKKNRIYALIENVYTKLDIKDKDELSKAFIQRLDNKKMFFLRLDKQKAYLGKIKLSTIDPILIKIKLNFYPNNFKEIINPNK
jgi:RNA binding exosome subunit